MAAPPRRPAGFTLLELMLALSVLLVLTGVMVYGFSGWQRTALLDEGAQRFATLLRMLRAESAMCGKRLRLAFTPAGDATSGATIETLCEREPLDGPEAFTSYEGALWQAGSPAQLVRVIRCRLTGPARYPASGAAAGGSPEGLAPPSIDFYPDGSSDSAIVYLVSVNAKDTRVAVVELNGHSGSASSRILTAAEFQELQAE
jgi:prepilin-type N-terminal cleavage/methylation domain-containing protein